MEIYQVKVDGFTLNCDDIGYEYSQLDGEGAGRSESGTMYRDVIGLTNKLYTTHQKKAGKELTDILKLLKKTSGIVTFFDPSAGTEGDWVTKKMYVVGDRINAKIIEGIFRTIEPFEIRFIQMDVD